MADPRGRRTSNPFPGLRPFRPEEDYLFFGRESQVDAMVDGLAATRFLVVVGTSGSGKSSLVNCGLVPALRRGLMAEAGTSWRIARFRPGMAPISELAKALARDGVLFRDFEAGPLSLTEIVEATLRLSKLGLIDICQQAPLDPDDNILVVADQFEELFRYRQLGGEGERAAQSVSEEAAAFVNLLLQVRDHPDCPVRVVLTMRSDFLGDCARFPGLPEAINASQFLVPRMTRDERRAAITGPIRVAGAEIEPVLVTRLVNDVGDNPDQLSVLQHALNRTWAHWEDNCNREGPIHLEHYEAIGTMAHALDVHAERAFAELDEGNRQDICEKLFKALTDKATDSRGVRRPTRLETLCILTRADQADVARVIDVFRKPSRSFLMPPHDEALEPETVVDISHESLMRGWRRLSAWADEEARSAQFYGRLADTAALNAQGRASLWRDPELQFALDWREREHPLPEWADRYRGGFEQAMTFLDASAAAQDDERRQAALERRRKVRFRNVVIVGSGLVAMVLAVLGARDLVKSAENEALKLTNEHILVSQGASDYIARLRPVRAALTVLRALGTEDEDLPLYSRVLFERMLWQAHASSHLVKILPGHNHQVRAVEFNNSGTRLASGDFDGRALIFDTSDWSPVAEIDENKDVPSGEWNWILGLAFSPDGKLLATASGSKQSDDGRRGRVRFWHVETGERIHSLAGSAESDIAHDEPARSVAFSKNGRWLVSTSYDNSARVWDVTAGHLVTQVGQQVQKDLYAASFNPRDSSIVAAGGNDAILRVWCIDGLKGPVFAPEDDAVGPDGGADRWCRDHPDGREMVLEGHKERITSLTFSPDGEELMSTSDDDTVRIWDWRRGVQAGRPLAAHGADIWRALFDPEGRRIFTVSWDRTIGVWDAETFEPQMQIGGHDGPIRSIAHDPFGNQVATGSLDETVRIWSLEPDDVVIRLKAYLGSPTTVRVNPADGEEFATAGGDGTVRIWKTGRRVPHQILDHILQGEGRRCDGGPKVCGVAELAFGAGGTRLAARYKDDAVRIWDIASGRMIGDAIGGQDTETPIRALTAFDGQDAVALGTTDGRVLFQALDGETDAELSPLDVRAALRAQGQPEAEAWITALDHNATLNRVAVGMADGLILIWELETGNALTLIDTAKFIESDKTFLASLRFSADGNRLFSTTGTGGTIHVWDVGETAPAATLSGHTGMVTDMTTIGGGRRLATVSTDETIKIWDVEQGYEVVSLPGHDNTITSVSYDPSSGRLLTAAEDGTVLIRRVFTDIWDLRRMVCDTLAEKNLEAGAYFKDGQSLDDLCPASESGG